MDTPTANQPANRDYQPGSPTVAVDRWTLEDADWLGHIEDWLLHADHGHAVELADVGATLHTNPAAHPPRRPA